LYVAGAARGVTILGPQFEVQVLWFPIACETANALKPTVTTARMASSPTATAICVPLYLRIVDCGRAGAYAY
jgi:hypothetical protein